AEYDLPSPFERIFDDIRWYNFHDSKDPVSGHLDYYDKVHNVHMDYAKKKERIRFSHAEYWKDPDMFAEIIDRFIAADAPVVHE
ncbi:MAG TPA: hypothetical protein VLA34_00935, partial [Candidatus Krumholzibacterium sp.]|nr:hypothetical protein [Candidatus Krumholzibacterium sp.]